MASGSSSGRVNVGSKVYDFADDDILCSYEDYKNLESANGNYSDPAIGANSGKELHKSRMAKSSAFPASSYSPPEESNNQDLISTVERMMKKYADNLMRFLEGISSRLSQLELYCYNLDKSIGEMHSELARDNSDADSKLKLMEKHLQEVRRSVQILRDKQELAEAHRELAKVQLPQESNSSIHSQQSEERASPPVSDPRKNDNTSDVHGQQLALALPNHVSPQPSLLRQVEQRQQPISQHPAVAPQGLPPSQGYYLHQVQHPNIPPSHLPAQVQQAQAQYLPSDSQYQTPPQPTQSQANQTPHNHSSHQYQQQRSQHLSQQAQVQQASLQPQIRPPVLAASSSYMPSQAPNPSIPETLLNSMSMKMSFSGNSQPTSSHAEAMSYVYATVNRPVQPQPLHQHLKATFGAHPGDGYVTSGHQHALTSGNTYMMYGVESGPPPLSQSHMQQSGYPQSQQPPTSRMVSPPQLIRNHPYSELIDKLVIMGYRGDLVVTEIQRMEESGQHVDFNAVLDRLNAHSSGVSQRAWSG